MDLPRTPSSSTQDTTVNQQPNQPNERPAPPAEFALRRFCHRCTKYIDRTPFLVSICCGDSYHSLCVTHNRDVRTTICSDPDCKINPMKYFWDLEFAEAAKQYDWSVFEGSSGGTPRDEGKVSVAVQTSDNLGPVEPAGRMASLQEQ